MNDKYLHFDLEDFLVDDAFLDWVLRDDKAPQWDDWLSLHREKASLIMEARQMVSHLKFQNQAIPDGSKNRVWDRIEESTSTEVIKLVPKKKTERIYYVAIAASIVLLCVLYFYNPSISYTTDDISTEIVELPAKSNIEFGPSSSIKYQEKNWSRERNVVLEGYAHFSITKGVPFKVNTLNGTVEVLGTEFDVASFENSFYVKVTEGSVKASAGNRTKTLTQNMSFYYNPSWSGQYSIDNNWKSDDMFYLFKNQTLDNVLKTISYAYDIEFDTSNISTDINFTGSFSNNEDVQTVLEKILWPLKLRFQINNDTINLSSE